MEIALMAALWSKCKNYQLFYRIYANVPNYLPTYSFTVVKLIVKLRWHKYNSA
jgi:hypothetical protein